MQRGYCRSHEWLAALEMGILKKLPEGSLEAVLKSVSDNGCQLINNPKGNADTERLMRTMKEECLWLSEWISFEQLQKALNSWIDFYNK